MAKPSQNRADPIRIHSMMRVTRIVLGFIFALSLTAAIGLQFAWVIAAARTPLILMGLGGDRSGLQLSIAWPAVPSPAIEYIYEGYDGDVPNPRLKDLFVPENFSNVGFEILGFSLDRRWALPGPGGSLTIGLHHAWLLSIIGTLYLSARWLNSLRPLADSTQGQNSEPAILNRN